MRKLTGLWNHAGSRRSCPLHRWLMDDAATAQLPARSSLTAGRDARRAPASLARPRCGDSSTRRANLSFVPHWLCSLLHWLSLHWGDVVPAWLAVLVAAFFGYLSWRASRRSKDAEKAAKMQADRATTAAEDAVRAQKEIAGETRRIADAMQESSDAAEQKPWGIVKGSHDRHRLVNTTATPKYHVSLRGNPVRGRRAQPLRCV